MNWLARLAAQALEPDEREMVLGDLAESGCSEWRAFGEVFGLVMRRQLAPWANWRPWFALIGVAGVSGFFLYRIFGALCGDVFEQVSALRRHGVHYNVGVTSFQDDVVHMCCLAATILCWTAVNRPRPVAATGDENDYE